MGGVGDPSDSHQEIRDVHPLLAQTAQNPAWWAPVVIVIGVVGMGVLLTMSIRGKVVRRQASTPSARDRMEEIKARGSAASAANRETAAEIDAVDRAAHLAALLDNKAARLESLIAQADARLTELRRQLQASPTRAASGSAVTRGDDAELLAELERASILPETDVEPVTSAAAPQDAEPPPDETSANIYDLADRGMSPLEIAQQLDEQVGKVELILALRAQSS